MKTPKFSSVAAPVDRPIPLWILYPLFFTAIYLSHYTLLRLPYFWDEAGYYIPAALDFYQTGSLIPHSTLTNAHPPLPSLLLASWWHLAGLVITDTRTFIAAIAAAALLGIYRLARSLAGTPVAAAVTVLTAIYPIWFTQSTLAHADIFAAAFTLWALSFYFGNPGGPSIPASSAWVGSSNSDPATARTLTAILFSLAALSKETAIVTPIALAAWELLRFFTEKRRPTYLAALLTPILPLVAWYAYHRHATGFIFGNPEFLRYNATANLTPLRVLLSLYHRIVHLTFHMNLYVPVLCTIAVLFLGKRDGSTTTPGAPGLASEAWVLQPGTLKTIAVIILGNALAFSILGGALLTRYLLPLYPLVLLICIATWYQRLPKHWPWLALLTAAAFVVALFVNPPYPFAPEDNLTYRDMIVLHQQAALIITQRYPYATVLTAWPATTELEHPQLGYVPHPIKIVPIDNFAADQIAKAATNPGAYDTALIFSTKWTPTGALNLARASESNDTRYFDYHRDLTPTEAALALHGDIIWQRANHGEWAAVLRFPRSNEARLTAPASR